MVYFRFQQTNVRDASVMPLREIKDTAVGIVCPVYCGNMPKIVRRFLKKAGIKMDYAATVQMVDNFLLGFAMEDQIQTVGEKHIDEQISQIRQDIEARRRESMR